jgi:cytochrome c556
MRHRIAATALILLVAGSAVAASGASAIKDRQQHMKAMGAAFKMIGEQVHSGKPDLAVVKVQAAKVDAGAKDLPRWFPAGSGAGAKTEALPLIWTDAAGFAAKQRTLAEAAARLDAVAGAGDSAAIGPAAKAVRDACKGCHDTYKAKDKT